MAHPVLTGSLFLDIVTPQPMHTVAEQHSGFVEWLNVLHGWNKALAFQMIDSFRWHWDQTHKIAAHYRFDFPQQVAPAARVFERHIRSMTHAEVDQTLEFLMNLRPEDIQPLIPIVVDGPPLEEMLKSQTRQYQRIFRGFDHEQAVKEDYDRLNDKKRKAAVPDCIDFPEDIETQHMLAEELFDAIMDCSQVEEKPRLIVTKAKKRKASELEDDDGDHNHDGNNENETAHDDNNRRDDRDWADNTYVKRIKMAKDIEIQFIVWNLLRRMRDAQSGLVGIGPWATNWKFDQFKTFRDRFYHCKAVCLKSKTVVASMMTSEDIFTKRFAAGPLKELHQKRANKTTNEKRDEQNKVALYVQSKGWVLQDKQSGKLVDLYGARVAPSPPRPDSATANDHIVPQNPAMARNIEQDQYGEHVALSLPRQPASATVNDGLLRENPALTPFGNVEQVPNHGNFAGRVPSVGAPSQQPQWHEMRPAVQVGNPALGPESSTGTLSTVGPSGYSLPLNNRPYTATHGHVAQPCFLGSNRTSSQEQVPGHVYDLRAGHSDVPGFVPTFDGTDDANPGHPSKMARYR